MVGGGGRSSPATPIRPLMRAGAMRLGASTWRELSAHRAAASCPAGQRPALMPMALPLAHAGAHVRRWGQARGIHLPRVRGWQRPLRLPRPRCGPPSPPMMPMPASTPKPPHERCPFCREAEADERNQLRRFVESLPRHPVRGRGLLTDYTVLCLWCFGPMPLNPGPGRPRRFCSSDCRTAYHAANPD